ncbi:unnamed protein product [Blepharisma stoltei]|uniref:Nuclear factor related to kappa-B-binding protein second winged helix domain-containing protein n=1 Tax=Blepharisma stoltei TaxID=1481888 RepID=A0AAU9JZ87_9CILI|nr:unnamed protein product [Blepharisma stoltei]
MEDWTDIVSESEADLDLQIEAVTESSESSDEEDEISKTYLIQGKKLRLPKLIEQVDLLDVFTVDVWSDLITDKDRSELISLLPSSKVNQTLEELFTHQIFHMFNPIQEFSEKICKGHYTSAHKRVSRHAKALFDDDLYQYTTKLKTELPEKLKSLSYEAAKSVWIRRKLAYHEFESDSSSDESVFSHDFDECTSGDSTIIDEEEEALYEIAEKPRKGEDEEKENELKKVGNLDWVKYSSRFKDLNIHKNQLTIRMSSLEWVEKYRKQETDRYNNPTLPWAYQLEDGTIAIVAPVCKKLTSTNIKPRDHQCLKPDRPAYLTLLSITRDAAARLQDGVGTRADICALVRDSQFIVENASDTQISNLVSGALDRLHYEKDPCVKYDPERKLWFYLHRGRGLDFAGWRSELPVKRGRPAVTHVQEIATKEYLPPYLEEDEVTKRRKGK